MVPSLVRFGQGGGRGRGEREPFQIASSVIQILPWSEATNGGRCQLVNEQFKTHGYGTRFVRESLVGLNSCRGSGFSFSLVLHV